MNKGEHLNLEGLHKMVAIRSSLNLGLTTKLKDKFSGINPVLRPSVLETEFKDPNWLVGFIEGEGCFFIDIYKSKTLNIGYQVKLKFQITQNSRDYALMSKIQKFLNCGSLRIIESRSALDIVVNKFTDIESIIIPLFENYPLQGNKQLDFEDFCKAALAIKNKEHLTVEGLEFIKKIKSGMNTGRN